LEHVVVIASAIPTGNATADATTVHPTIKVRRIAHIAGANVISRDPPEPLGQGG
jgi:hypothetical protein